MFVLVDVLFCSAANSVESRVVKMATAEQDTVAVQLNCKAPEPINNHQGRQKDSKINYFKVFQEIVYIIWLSLGDLALFSYLVVL